MVSVVMVTSRSNGISYLVYQSDGAVRCQTAVTAYFMTLYPPSDFI